LAPVWEIAPNVPLAAIDRLRLADDTSSPLLEHGRATVQRRNLEAQVRAALADNAEALSTFEVGLRSAAHVHPWPRALEDDDHACHTRGAAGDR
jgi:hypothetical protein